MAFGKDLVVTGNVPMLLLEKGVLVHNVPFTYLYYYQLLTSTNAYGVRKRALPDVFNKILQMQLLVAI